MIQNIIALFIVLIAVGYVVYKMIQSMTAKKGSGCGGGSGCSCSKAPGIIQDKIVNDGKHTSSNCICS